MVLSVISVCCAAINFMSVENMVIYLCKLQPTVVVLRTVNTSVPAPEYTHNKHTPRHAGSSLSFLHTNSST